jgi:DNA-binding IclR family transcriptional regulator
VAGNSADAGRSVTSKVVAILLTFTDGSLHSLSEIARLAGLPTSTVHRLVTELAAWGLLERTDEGQYRVGVALRAVGSQMLHEPSLQEHGRRVMEDLSAATRCAVRMGVLEDGAVSFIEKRAWQEPVSSAKPRPLPAHASAMGKALLAFSPPGVVEGVIARGLYPCTPYTLTTADRLRKALSVVRTARIAVSRWELRAGESSVAVPVFCGGGNVVAALELSVRDLRNDLRVVQAVLLVAGRSLSRELVTSQPSGRPALVDRARPAAGRTTRMVDRTRDTRHLSSREAAYRTQPGRPGLTGTNGLT